MYGNLDGAWGHLLRVMPEDILDVNATVACMPYATVMLHRTVISSPSQMYALKICKFFVNRSAADVSSPPVRPQTPFMLDFRNLVSCESDEKRV